MYSIYIIYSKTADKYYIGYSDNPKRRLIEHNTKEFNTYTKKHRPWKLVYSFPVSTCRSDAVKIERFIKKQKSRKLIETIISEKKTIVDFNHLLDS